LDRINKEVETVWKEAVMASAKLVW